MRARRAEAGQASVETVALLPLVALCGALLWQAAVAGQALWLSAAAARAAARAAAVGADAEAAASGALPPRLEAGLRVRAARRRRPRRRSRVPSVLSGGSIFTVRSRAAFPERSGRIRRRRPTRLLRPGPRGQASVELVALLPLAALVALAIGQLLAAGAARELAGNAAEAGAAALLQGGDPAAAARAALAGLVARARDGARRGPARRGPRAPARRWSRCWPARLEASADGRRGPP